MKKTLNEIDISYWNVKDKEWMAQRKTTWPRIEAMLVDLKPRKALSIIKAYYLKGRMPNWKMLEDWGDERGHLDIFVFLWLHPSWAESVLKELRDLYINSRLIIERDLSSGFGRFLGSQSVLLTQDWETMEEVNCPYLEGHGELLFQVMLGNPIQTIYEIKAPKLARMYGREYQIRPPELDFVDMMGVWLTNKNMLPITHDFLYQYDQPLEWWYENCTKNEEFFAKQVQEEAVRNNFKMALYRIHNFNTQKEGDTCRTRFVHKIRKIL
ncbi:MAG: hypothetical protein GY705_05775, partial [Bacteroidetes bacterium]|nr:hypothetical protein [Bacteroidota bacterium]